MKKNNRRSVCLASVFDHHLCFQPNNLFYCMFKNWKTARISVSAQKDLSIRFWKIHEKKKKKINKKKQEIMKKARIIISNPNGPELSNEEWEVLV